MDLTVINYLHDLFAVETFPTDFDKQFIDDFISVYLQSTNALKELRDYYESSASKNLELLLAVYIETLRKAAKERGVFLLEDLENSRFLRMNEGILFAKNAHFTLQQTLYGLLTDLEVATIVHPFRTGIIML